MSITRKMLKGMGLTEDQQDTILEAHTETVNEIKAERDRLKADAEKLPDIQKQLDDLKAAGDDGFEAKYNAEKKAFSDYKAEITAKEIKAAKEKAVRAYFESKNIEGANLNIAMRSSAAEIDAVELDGDKIKDTAALDALVNGDYAGLVSKTTTRVDMGARFNTDKKPVTKEDIVAIKDGATRRKMIAENPELFGLSAKND